MCFLPGVLSMFQLEFFKNSRFSLFYSDFKIKSSENSCKNEIFVILFKIGFKYTKRRRILNENGVFHISKPIPRSFELFPQHSCQVVYHRPPKLPETGNTFSRSFFQKKVLDFCEMG